jgi:hydrogenase maturation protease
MNKTLILYMGNPIVKNDQIGLIVGARLSSILASSPGVDAQEFSGSPLDFVAQISDYNRVILVDSVSTGRQPVGSVVLYTQEEILKNHGDVYLHGMNLSEALALGRRMQIPFPTTLHLIGIEAGTVDKFSDSMSIDLADRLGQIICEARRIVDRLIYTSQKR